MTIWPSHAPSDPIEAFLQFFSETIRNLWGSVQSTMKRRMKLKHSCLTQRDPQKISHSIRRSSLILSLAMVQYFGGLQYVPWTVSKCFKLRATWSNPWGFRDHNLHRVEPPTWGLDKGGEKNVWIIWVRSLGAMKTSRRAIEWVWKAFRRSQTKSEFFKPHYYIINNKTKTDIIYIYYKELKRIWPGTASLNPSWLPHAHS
jgi:hypothetical protein